MKFPDGHIEDYSEPFWIAMGPDEDGSPEEGHRPGAQLPMTDEYAAHLFRIGFTTPDQLAYRVERTLEPGDEIYVEGVGGKELEAAWEKAGMHNVGIGAFWQVQDDGSLKCTGT